MFEKFKRDFIDVEGKIVSKIEGEDLRKIKKISAILREQAQTVEDLSDTVLENREGDDDLEAQLKHHLKTMLTYLKEAERAVMTALKLELEREEKEQERKI